MVLFGRRFNAGWRSHTQQIVIGLSTASIAQMGVRGIWQPIAMHAAPHTQAEYERVMGIQEKLYNANSVNFCRRAGLVDRVPLDRRAGK